MAYNDTPLSTDLISESQPDIRENFQLLEDSQVVDEGSTADGDYIRYENGWQLCIAIHNIDLNTTDRRDFDSPNNFVDSNAAASIVLLDGQTEPISGVSQAYQSIVFQFFSNEWRFMVEDTTDATRDFGMFAIGRWK